MEQIIVRKVGNGWVVSKIVEPDDGSPGSRSDELVATTPAQVASAVRLLLNSSPED